MIGFLSDKGYNKHLVFFGYWMLSDTKLPLQEPKEKWVSMKRAGEEVKTGFL